MIETRGLFWALWWIHFLPDAVKNGQMSSLSRAVLQAHTGLAVETPATIDGEMLHALVGELATVLPRADLPLPELHMAVVGFIDAPAATAWLAASIYDSRLLIEICMLVGHYEMLAMTLNTLRVQPERPPHAA